MLNRCTHGQLLGLAKRNNKNVAILVLNTL